MTQRPATDPNPSDPGGATAPDPANRSVRFRVGGTVQGVGFRPWVHALALRHGLVGWVGNDESGVVGEVGGDADAVGSFLTALRVEPPALAVVEGLETAPVAPLVATSFTIRASRRGGPRTAMVPPDTAVCADCAAEVADPTDRHHRHPFTSCSACGPRLSIIEDLPYDRSTTTMAGFPLCGDCAGEYADPAGRRFHAETIACPACGPRLRFERVGAPTGNASTDSGAMAATVDALRGGAIVAVKGVGGFHLAVRADDALGVARLRSRKHRADKPFAVMVADLDAARRWCHVGPAEAALLGSPAAPIVLCRRNLRPSTAADAPAEAVAPGRHDLGLLLPPTPLHQLLASDLGVPLVLTSGNVSDEPIAHHDDDARHRLAGIADAFLLHDRVIRTRVEDSVADVVDGSPRLLRRSRGYAPAPVRLPMPADGTVLGSGAALKSTFCLARGHTAVLSAHLGDLEHEAAVDAYEDALELMCRLIGREPELVVHDLHPDYASTRIGRRLAHERGLPTLGVQHHHAHIAAVMVEHGWTEPVIGVVYDGLGLGPDGTLWGGEFLLADLSTATRLAHLDPVPMPGGTAAIRQPWRMLASYLDAAGVDVDGITATAGPGALDVVRLARSGINSPPTSGMGRLFDAVGALVTGRRTVTHEAQAAIELQHLVPAAADPSDRYEWTPQDPGAGGALRLPAAELVATVRDDLLAGSDPGTVAARFHHTVAATTVEVVGRLREITGVGTVTLCGGVMQNLVLLVLLERGLSDAGHRVLSARQIPPNDGAISLGQAAIGANVRSNTAWGVRKVGMSWSPAASNTAGR